jgi:hypothetical protein
MTTGVPPPSQLDDDCGRGSPCVVERHASDLLLVADAKPSLKITGAVVPLSEAAPLTAPEIFEAVSRRCRRTRAASSMKPESPTDRRAPKASAGSVSTCITNEAGSPPRFDGCRRTCRCCRR